VTASRCTSDETLLAESYPERWFAFYKPNDLIPENLGFISDDDWVEVAQGRHVGLRQGHTGADNRIIIGL